MLLSSVRRAIVAFPPLLAQTRHTLCALLDGVNGFSEVRAHAVARQLDVGLDGICFACLGMVSMALDSGDRSAVVREVRRMTPDLWADGLEEPALAAVRRAVELGVPDADAALDDLELGGGESCTARAIVWKLAGDLARRVHTTTQVEARARSRLLRAPPEWN